MGKRFTFKKITDGDFGLCYYCRKYNTHFALYDKKDGSEVFCCPEDALKVGKIKRLKKLLSKYPIRKNKAISKQNSLIKNSEDVTIGEVSIPEEQGRQDDFK